MASQPSPSTEYEPYHDDEETLEDADIVPNLRPMSSPSNGPSLDPTLSPRIIILLVFTTIFILTFGSSLIGVPCLRIYEDIVCRNYYAGLEGEGRIELGGSVDESMCKGEEVQSKLNLFLAVLTFLSAIPGMV
jgi:hypothetical protein